MTGATVADVRDALRRELEARGLGVADDTIASRGEIYVKGAGDLAAGLFEFKRTVEEAIQTMYQGHWTEGLPPRFAVLPAEASDDPSFDLLKQMHIIPLLYEDAEGTISFVGLDEVVGRLRLQREWARRGYAGLTRTAYALGQAPLAGVRRIAEN